jgi:hypothetical protein
MIFSTESSSRFGLSMQWINHGDLVVSAPKFSGTSWYTPNDSGKLHLISGANLLRGDIDAYWVAS